MCTTGIADAHRGQKRALDPLQVVWQTCEPPFKCLVSNLGPLQEEVLLKSLISSLVPFKDRVLLVALASPELILWFRLVSNSQKSPCFSFPNVEIADTSHYTW